MKRYILLFSILLISLASFSQKSKGAPEMIFKDTIHNFNTIWYMNEASHEFTFKNTGKLPLIIERVRSSCGCTVPTWEKSPVPPKGKGKITVKYDTKRIGQFQKSIKIYSNALNSPVILVIMGAVKVTD